MAFLRLYIENDFSMSATFCILEAGAELDNCVVYSILPLHLGEFMKV